MRTAPPVSVDQMDNVFESLSEGTRLLDLILEQSGVGIIIVDAKGVIRALNPEAEAQHGRGFAKVPPAEWIETYGLRKMDGSKLKLTDVALYRALQGEQRPTFTYLVRHPDGPERVISGHANPLWLASGQLAGAVVISRDETDRFHAEQLSAAARLDLERSQRLTRRLLDNSSDVLLFLDMGGNILWANPRAAATFARGQASLLVGRPFVGMWVEASQAVARECLGEAAAGRPARFIGQAQADEGTRPWWSIEMTYDPDIDNRCPGVFVSMRDITALKRVEAEVRAQARFAQQLIGIVSHDLRNPISAILLSAAQIKRHFGGDARVARGGERIIWAAKRANRLIYDLLDFTQSRLGGGLKVKPAACDVATLARRTLEEVAEQHPERKIDLDVGEDTAAEVDADRLAQVLLNLTSNAIQHGPADAAIRVRIAGDAERLYISVNNPGPVIPAETLALLFEPMQRGVTSGGKTRSIGLGLYIVRCIALAHRGDVRAESTLAGGNTFTLEVPRQQPTADVSAPAPRAPHDDHGP